MASAQSSTLYDTYQDGPMLVAVAAPTPAVTAPTPAVPAPTPAVPAPTPAVPATAHAVADSTLTPAVASQPITSAFQYSPATNKRLSVPNLLEDPYETAKVEVGPSAIPGAGDGVFIKEAAAAGEVLRWGHFVQEQQQVVVWF
jgi:hypothetical protein